MVCKLRSFLNMLDRRLAVRRLSRSVGVALTARRRHLSHSYRRYIFAAGERYLRFKLEFLSCIVALCWADEIYRMQYVFM